MNAAAPVEPFTCGTCEARCRTHELPPGTPFPDCTRCGDPTRTFVGQVIDGELVTVTRQTIEQIERHGARVDGKPGVRLLDGREFYSARWL